MPTLNIPQTDPRTERIIRLLTELAMESPPFMQPFEQKPWLEKQVEVFLTLYRQYQENARVRAFLAEVDGGSRMDSSVEDAVWRGRKIARTYLEGVLRDVEEAKEKIGWLRNVEKDTREYEIGFTGNVQPKQTSDNKKEKQE